MKVEWSKRKLKRIYYLFIPAITMSSLTTKNTNEMPIKLHKCPACLEDKDISKKEYFVKCSTCVDGGYCVDCWFRKIQPNCGLAYETDPDTIKNAIKCPCCRTTNWRWVYDEPMFLLEQDVEGDPSCLSMVCV